MVRHRHDPRWQSGQTHLTLLFGGPFGGPFPFHEGRVGDNRGVVTNGMRKHHLQCPTM